MFIYNSKKLKMLSNIRRISSENSYRILMSKTQRNIWEPKDKYTMLDCKKFCCSYCEWKILSGKIIYDMIKKVSINKITCGFYGATGFEIKKFIIIKPSKNKDVISFFEINKFKESFIQKLKEHLDFLIFNQIQLSEYKFDRTQARFEAILTTR